MPSAYQIHGRTTHPWTTPAGLSNLRFNNDVPLPTAIPLGHALVRIRAAALNARDMMVISHDPVYPGEGEEGFDWREHSVRVKGAGSMQGTLRELGVFRDEELIRAPDHLSFEELAAIPATGATAIHALLYSPQPLRAGQTVLAQGTGGVSSFVIQIAAALGATVIATSSSDAKLEQAKKLGATHTINYTTHPSWSTEVLRLTSGKGVDSTIDVAGASTIQESLRSTRKGGQVCLVGFLSESKGTDLVAEMIFGAKTVYGVLAFTRGMVERAVEVYARNKGLRPQVGEVHGWEEGEVRKAFETLVRGGAVGKIVIKVGGED
ncbi:NAD(P)-binding protein [Westerdykella ornata]|uniref:NAD(P)-binding protein n=1 Tax=Westerdykella ornata TaxID=318751 RepID=A0A6A6J5Q0_WESOR|nr:NAD(P)-binding protein [Westerdykella ornata]KAF2271765.1 NAD(P)-binding protein [Westerdykella ornata]